MELPPDELPAESKFPDSIYFSEAHKSATTRKNAIHEAIMNLNTGELLLVAGKGHEKTQDYGRRKLFFSDQEIILKFFLNQFYLLLHMIIKKNYFFYFLRINFYYGPRLFFLLVF
mgnify:CR=1 FL=1